MVLKRRVVSGIASLAVAAALAGAMPGSATAAPVTTSATPLTVTVTADSSLPESQVPWQLFGTASKPLASWKLVVTQARTGHVVHVATGGPATSTFESDWNGFSDGHTPPWPIVNGMYEWKLWAVPADNPTAAATLVASAPLAVSQADPSFHSINNSGQASLYGVVGSNSSRYRAGTGVLYQGDGTGRLENAGTVLRWNFGSGANQVNTLLPFGFGEWDAKGFLARSGTGVLKYYPATDRDFGLVFDQTPVTIGGGWNIYDRLTAVTDYATGADDLVARDRSGVLWFHKGDPSTRKFAGRVRVGGGWQTYTQIVGVGDLNGDGAGDLIAVDHQGRLWRYFGNGRGGFSQRVQVGHGFGIYNALVGVGDLNDQGQNSFVARDAAGVLWRYDSRPDGTFKTRARISGGWNMFSRLY